MLLTVEMSKSTLIKMAWLLECRPIVHAHGMPPLSFDVKMVTSCSRLFLRLFLQGFKGHHVQ